MKKSSTICVKENLHSTPEVVKASARCKPAADRSKSIVDHRRVHIDPSNRDLSKRGNVRERTRSCHEKRGEQAITQAGTKTDHLNKTNDERTCSSVKTTNKQEGRQRSAVEESKKRSEGASAAHVQSCHRGSHWSGSTVRRYALYRGMLRSSATTEPTKSGSAEREVHFVNEGLRSSGMRMKTSSKESVELNHNKVQRPQTVVPVILDDVRPTFDFTRGFDLKGTQFPKRIYIREHVNNAIVDELVNVRNQEDWDRLTYMAPLRPITATTTDRPRDLRFRDLRDFDVYEYTFDWRRLVGD